MDAMQELLLRLIDVNGSDLHISEHHMPMMRVHGTLIKASDKDFTDAEIREMIFSLMNDHQKKSFQNRFSFDFAHEIPGKARFRCNVMRHQRGLGGVFRLIPSIIKSIDDLNLPKTLIDLSNTHRGLILITGPTGSGKSTTMAAMIDHINRTREAHIITLEDPIEFVHQPIKCRISQREIGTHATSFAKALIEALREDPDVILVGEMRDLETIAQTITAAETGALVFGTLHTNSAAKTITRILDSFPEEQREQIRIMMSKSIVGIVAQQLLPTQDHKSRVPAFEILRGSGGLSNIIREGKIHQIQTIIEMGRSEGMRTMDQSLQELVAAKKILVRDAYVYAIEKDKFLEGDIEQKQASFTNNYSSFCQNLVENIQEAKKNKQSIVLLNIAMEGIDLYYDVAGQKDISSLVSNITDMILKSARGYDSFFGEDLPKNYLVVLNKTDNGKALAQRVYDSLAPFIKLKTQSKKVSVDVMVGYAVLSDDISDAEQFIMATRTNIIRQASF
ncbi:type IV pilus twitching motility protein PilT [PVC group bacterium]|nr:type IV pilus twitching motility protein PilT [PVC group bacterium]